MDEQISSEIYQKQGISSDGQPPQNSFVWSYKKTRDAFVRKVYAILTVQLVIIGIIIVSIYSSQPLREYIERLQVFITVIVIGVLILITMCCCQEVARIPPMNFIYLFAFTVTLGIILGLVAVHYRIDIILMTVGILALFCFCVILFTFQTFFNFTTYGPYVCSVSMILIVIVLVFTFINPNNPVAVTIAVLGVLLFSFRLISDTQKIMLSNHRYDIFTEEYVFAALILFLNIVFIFRDVFESAIEQSETD